MYPNIFLHSLVQIVIPVDVITKLLISSLNMQCTYAHARLLLPVPYKPHTFLHFSIKHVNRYPAVNNKSFVI